MREIKITNVMRSIMNLLDPDNRLSYWQKDGIKIEHYLLKDDATGIGVADDFLFGPLGAGVGEGLILIFG